VKTVIDVGCARYGGDYSVERLIEMFSPDVVIGFDPAKDVSKAMPRADVLLATGANVVLRREAAWTYDGQVRFMEDGLNGQVGDAEHWPYVTCVDLARVIDAMPEGEVILKLDAEGAEIELLEHLIVTRADLRLSRVLVEWHPWNDPERRRAIEDALTCPLEEWRW
jgi:FkbM family methyltransferase